MCGTISVGRPPTAGGGEVAVELGERAAGQVDQHFGAGLVHRQGEAEAADAALVAERLLERAAERDGDILDAVVRVDLEVAGAGERQAEPAVRRDLVEHVVVEGDAAVDAARLGAVEVDGERDPGFLGVADDLGAARWARGWRRCRTRRAWRDSRPRCRP